MKVCTKCRQEKAFEAFYAEPRKKDGLRPHCKECMKAAQSARPSKNTEPAKKAEYARRTGKRTGPYIPKAERQQIAAMKRAARTRRVTLHNAHVHAYKAKLNNATRAERWRQQYACDAEFVLKQRVRTQLRKKAKLHPRLDDLMRAALNRCGRSSVVEQVCGYTIAALRRHLEALFTAGMTWEAFKQGRIHIDHIIPQAAFDLNDLAQVGQCWSLLNLQPLWSRENGSKSDLLPDGSRARQGGGLRGSLVEAQPGGQLRTAMFTSLQSSKPVNG